MFWYVAKSCQIYLQSSFLPSIGNTLNLIPYLRNCYYLIKKKKQETKWYSFVCLGGEKYKIALYHSQVQPQLQLMAG